jgi:hypothetical protein
MEAAAQLPSAEKRDSGGPATLRTSCASPRYGIMKRNVARGVFMPALSTSQRQWLRKAAHDLRPITQIGKNGLTEHVVQAVS